MRSTDPREQLFRALVLLSAATVAACGGGGAAASGDAGSTPDSYYPRSSVTVPVHPGCQEQHFVDTNPDFEGVQPNCQVILKAPCKPPGAGVCPADGYAETPLTRCIDPATGWPPSPYSSAQAQSIPDKDRPCWYLSYDRDVCPDSFMNQRIAVLEKAGAAISEGSLLDSSCLVCVGGIEVPCPAIDLSH